MNETHAAGGTAVAVLGTGIMGSAMARNLIGAGFRTTIWDRSPSATAGVQARAGAVVATSPQEALRNASLVISMLPTAAVTEIGDVRRRSDRLVRA